jgi:16S rRNA C967 or C1407 C5-methylase (RsmB/RsmF family)/NOL1/NOP2/fmu family ribosome biogenesis protein
MQLPEAFLESLSGLPGYDKDAFKKVHEQAELVTSIRINPFKWSIVNGQWTKTGNIHHSAPDSYRGTIHGNIPWTESGYYLHTRPSFTFDPLFHAGCYYVQEASSMFLEQVLKQTVDLSKPLRVLDLCAAPGGKSTHILSLISNDSLLVSNEVIRSRARVLNGNIVKWGCSNVLVTNNDPKDFQRLQNYFDVIVVDAPCSGSGLFRREPEAIAEWSEQNVMLCSRRQQRILADALPALKPGGVLIYSTCSYSIEEDEQIAEWLIHEWSMDYCQPTIDSEWGIVASGNAYRFWPDKVKGEGFFIACFRKPGENFSEFIFPKPTPEKFSRQERDLLKQFVKADGSVFFHFGKSIHAVPGSLLADINFLTSKLRAVNAGTIAGEIIRGKFLPGHALAMASILADDIPAIEPDFEQAIQYLRKKDLKIDTGKKGWCLVKYKGHPLGWVNVLASRINNYYPKELRILKE